MMKETISKNRIGSMLALGIAIVMVFAAVLPMITQNSYAAFTGKKGSKYNVWDGGQITYGSGSGGYSNSRKCDLDDDLGTRYSYCVQPNKASPGTGQVTVDKVVTDENDTGKWNALRNIIYYSPSYPGYEDNVKNIKDNYYTGNFSKDWGIAHLALSYVYAGRPDDMATWGGTHASDLGDVWTKAKKLGNALWKSDSSKDDAVPDSFKVFICYMSGVQDMIVGYMEAPGYVEMKKASNRTAITAGNGCYELAGAEYTVYDSDGKSVGVLKIKADGTSNTLELMEGKYTAKETKAPKGYAKDSTTYNLNVESDETESFTSKEEPITDLVNLLLTKKPQGYPHNTGEGDATLKGAVYKFKYYDGQYSTAAKAEESGNATATWYFVTDVNGKINGQSPSMSSEHQSSALYKDKDGKTAYPLGTYVIQEVTAPTGYLVNNEKLVVHVTEDGTDNLHVSTYNESASGEDTPIRGGVKLAKIDLELDEAYAQGDATLEGAEFTVYNKSKASVMVGGREIAVDSAALVIRTDANGIAASAADALPYGTYLVKETKPSTGYLLNENWSKTFSIRENGVIVDLTEDKVPEQVVRGGLKVTKVDADTGKTSPQGDAILDGTTFEIINNSAHDVLVGGTRYAHGKRVKTISTVNGVATTGNKDLPYGHYLVKEIGTMDGYHLNSTWQGEVFIDQDGVIKETDPMKIPDQVKRFGLKVQKIDNDLDEAYAQGDATLKGAEFTIWNKSKEGVVVRDIDYLSDQTPAVDWTKSKGAMPEHAKEVPAGDVAGLIRTDEQGKSATDSRDLPYGTYFIKETTPSGGYLLNDKWSFTIKVFTENGQDKVKIAGSNNLDGVNETLDFTDGMIIDLAKYMTREPVIRGGVQIIKRDKEILKSERLGGATLADIEFKIKNVSNHDVVVRKDLNNKTDTVDWKHLASKQEMFEAGTIKRVKPGEDVGKIVTHWNTEKKAYTAETLIDDLPYGTYTIRESKTNDSYQRSDKTEHMFEIREDGVMVSFDDSKNENALTFDDYVYRSDLQGTKIGDGDSRRFSYVPFKITSVSNDETHVVVADMNGYFTTKDQRTKDKLEEDEDADNTRKQNPFDDLLTAESITTEDIKERKEDILMGIWFGTGEFGTKAKMDGNYGALPYDTYIIEELRCEKNEGYTLQKFMFTVDDKSRNGFVDLETITDDIPEIGTEASVNGENANITPDRKITLIDKVSYTGLKKGEKYTIKGRLIDKKTGEVVKDAAGEEVTAEKEFTPFFSSGSVKVKFEFDGSKMHGLDTVVFEQLYGADGHIVCKHEEPDDEGQTVTWEKPEPSYEMYKIRTTKAPSKGDQFGFFAQDEVEYEVHVENTGNTMLTMDVWDEFTQNPEYFTEPQLKDVKFSGDGVWNNKADYEKKEAADEDSDGKETAAQDTQTEASEGQVATSSDSDADTGDAAAGGDTDQTGVADPGKDGVASEVEADAGGTADDVAIGGDAAADEDKEQAEQKEPKQIANITLHPGEKAVVTYTAVVSDEAKEYLAAAAKDSDSLDDNDKDTNQAYQKNKTDDEDGYWNTAHCENVTYPNPENPDEPGTLEPKEDVAQTPVQKPEIGTTLADEEGSKEVVASKETVLVDTISYKALDPSKWYVFTGTLMVKDTKEPLVENGTSIEVTSEPFQPEEPDGEAAVTFVIDTTDLAGKELVAFETAYRLEGYEEGQDIEKAGKTVVAEHKDINDEGQTVKIKDQPKTEKPQTPEIGTTLADKEGNKEVVAAKKTTLVDTIAYKGLDPSKWYVFTGTLMVKDTKDPLVENGKPVEVTSEPFQPKEADGEATVTFVIDTTNLAGKELVAFETAYRLEDYEEGSDMQKIKKTVVAEHKDLNDKGQTVKIKDKDEPDTPGKTTKTGTPSTSGDTPKTGDERKPWIWLSLMAAGLAAVGGSVLLFRRREY